MSEISPAENRYLSVMRDLDGFSRDHFGVEIIDHDYAPDHQPLLPPHNSLDGFRRELHGLYDDIDGGERDSQFMRRNIESTDLVIDALAGRLVIGQDISLPDYVQGTLGIRPEIVPEETLTEQRSEVAEAVTRLGYAYEEEDWEDFKNDHAIPSKQMEDTVLRLAGITRDDLAAAAGEDALKGIEEPRITAVRAEDTWQGYFGTEDKELVIKMNTNPLIRISELEERLALVHERAHGLSAGISKSRIATGDLGPTAGILLCSSPAYPQEEVIARAAERYMVDNEPGNLARYVGSNIIYQGSVHNNMILKVNSGELSKDEAVEYGRSRLPYEESGKPKQDVAMYTDSLVFKTVFPADVQAIAQGGLISAMPSEQRREVMARLCAGPIYSGEPLVPQAGTNN